MKTARFSQIVAKCGKPMVHDQWVAPEKDSALKQAVKQNRLMTVRIHTVGATKDYGEVGLVKTPQRVLLVFPKSLRAFQDRRIVGVKYDLLKEMPLRAAKKTAPPREKEKASAEQPSEARASEHMLRLFQPDKEPADAKEDTVSEEPPEKRSEAKKGNVKKTKAEKPAPKNPKTKKAKPQQPEHSHKTPAAPQTPVTERDSHHLLAAIHKAMKQLQSGKAVQAYQTLESAVT